MERNLLDTTSFSGQTTYDANYRLEIESLQGMGPPSSDSSDPIVGKIIFIVIGTFCVIALLSLALMVILRADTQPLKRQSPRLLALFLIGNSLVVLLMTIVQTENLSCQNPLQQADMSKCKPKFTKTSQISGQMVFFFAEPILFISFLLRYFRVIKIFQAQELEPKESREMIQKYTEQRLMIYTIVISCFLTLIYMIVYITHPQNGMFMPSYAFQNPENNNQIISLFSMIVALMLQGVVFGSLFHQVQKQVLEDFAIIIQLQFFFLAWIVTSNVILFILIQGLSSNWFDGGDRNQMTRTLQTVFSCFIICRSLIVSFGIAGPPIARIMKLDKLNKSLPEQQSSSQNQDFYYPIPPNRECIQSVDMVLHIPIAVDYFYEYLIQREKSQKQLLESSRQSQDPSSQRYGNGGIADSNTHDQKNSNAAICFFALYIDLRMYDKACADNEPIEVLRQIAQEIYMEYLDKNANGEFFVCLDSQVRMLFDSKFESLETNLNEYLFIEVYAFVLDKLRQNFSYFKSSKAFQLLEQEIQRQERLYQVLVDSDLIDNQ